MDDDVLALADSIADFFEQRGDAVAIAEASAGTGGTDPARWSALCEMGLPVLRLDEPDGIGAGLLEATAVAEKIGSVLLPEPAVASIVLADAWARQPAAAGLLDRLCAGSWVTALSAFDRITVAPSGEVTGSVMVADDGIDALAVLGRDEGTGAAALAVVDATELPQPVGGHRLDPTRPMAVMELSAVQAFDVLPLSDREANRIRREFAVLTAAELVGGMAQVLADTVTFVGSREQFGRPIGSFQAVKHQLADVYALTEQARALVQFAALSSANDGDGAADVVGSVTRWVPRQAINVFETAIHLHGGMGFSWEVNVHLHLKRALALRTLLNGFEAGSSEVALHVPEAV
jgi:alkylation response protein AidB-like acyl-CoA dehydrogenase